MLNVRRDSDDVLELLTMLVEDESSDSESEEDLEMLCILVLQKRKAACTGARKTLPLTKPAMSCVEKWPHKAWHTSDCL